MVPTLYLCLLLLLVLPTSISLLEAEYSLLGITAEDNLAALKRAHRTLSIKHHPDKNPQCGAECTSQLAAINAAYDRIIYSRKHTDAPELEAFFGFSEKLYNLIHDFWGLWENIPQADKDNVWSSWETYQSSETFEDDIKHFTVLVKNYLSGVLSEHRNALLVWIFVVVGSTLSCIVGFFYMSYWLLWLCTSPIYCLVALAYKFSRRVMGLGRGGWGWLMRPFVGAAVGVALRWAVSECHRSVFRVPLFAGLLELTVLPLSILCSFRVPAGDDVAGGVGGVRGK